MRKGLSPIVAAVILIAATMSIAGILTFWTTGFVSKKLNESSSMNSETSCLGAEFKLRPESKYNNDTSTLYLVVENVRSVDLKLENLYLFKSDGSMIPPIPLKSTLLKGEIKPLNIVDAPNDFVSGTIKTNCPTVSLDFTYSNGAIG